MSSKSLLKIPFSLPVNSMNRARRRALIRDAFPVPEGADKVLGSFQFAFDERLVDNDLGGDVRQFASLPGFHLLAHRLKVSLHSVDTDGDTVDE
jgi:hypothetical protein